MVAALRRRRVSDRTEKEKPPGATGRFFYCVSGSIANPRRERGLHVGRIDLLVQIGVQLVVIEFAFPPRHHHAGDAVAAQIGQRAALAHELVDAENDGHARHQPRIDHGKRRRQRDEARAGDAGRALRGQHRDQQDGELLAEGEIEAERLRDEQGRQRHVDVGAVEVERITGRHHEADDRLGAAEPLELFHQGRQRAFRGRRAEHDQQFVLDVGQELEDREPDHARDHAEHDEHEQRRGEVECRDQAHQVQDRAGSEPADGERHRAERADRGGLHHDGDDAENAVRGVIDEGAQRMAALAETHQREAEQDRKQQDLEDFALREGADDGIRNDMQEEIDALLRLGLLGVAGDGLRVRHAAAETRAGPDHIADDKTDHQREGGDDFEIDQRLDADAADLLGILYMRDAGYHGAEDDRRDHHLDQLDEAVAERLDPVVGRKAGHSQPTSAPSTMAIST